MEAGCVNDVGGQELRNSIGTDERLLPEVGFKLV